MKNTLKVFLIIIFLLFFFPLKTSTAFAQSTLFTDNFNNNLIETDVWSVKNYAVEDSGSYSNISELSVSETNSEVKFQGTGAIDTVTLDGQTVGNLGTSLILINPISITEKMFVEANVTLVSSDGESEELLTIEFDSNNRIGLSLISTNLGRFIQINLDEFNSSRCPIDENSIGCSSLPFVFSNNQTLQLKLEFDPSTKVVKGYVNDMFLISGKYNGEVSLANIGMASTVRNIGNSIDARFDDFKISTIDAITPTLTPTDIPSPTNTPTNTPIPTLPPTPTSIPNSNYLNVPDIKQFSSPWGSQEYDSALNWSPNNPNISRWGCALTSASMILNYHGFPINPTALNDWLKLQPDGYIRNGGIMWTAISRYSRFHKAGFQPSLEFNYKTPDNESLADDIEAGRPGIIKFQKPTTGSTHLVVARGISVNEFIINDPATNNTDPEMTEVSTKWGTWVKTGMFTPSYTDLSYIVLLITDGFSLKVFDINGVEVTTGYEIENPLSSDDQTANSGSPLNAFYLPKPESGFYRAEVTGNGEFILDTYLYDVNGNVTPKSFTELINTGKTKSFSLYLNKDDYGLSYATQLTLNSFLVDWDFAIQGEKIKNKGISTSVYQLIENAIGFKSRNSNFAARVLLTEALLKIKIATPIFIDQYTSNFFQSKIEHILDTL